MFNADCHVEVVYLIMCKPTTLLHATLYVLFFFVCTFFNLLYCLNDWTCAIMNHHSVAVAYIDFQKAFDSVCHIKLLVRLASLGIAGNLCHFWSLLMIYPMDAQYTNMWMTLPSQNYYQNTPTPKCQLFKNQIFSPGQMKITWK